MFNISNAIKQLGSFLKKSDIKVEEKRSYSINRDIFFAEYKKAFGPLKQSQVDGLNILLSLTEEMPFDNISFLAYAFATVKHECADKWMPITEYGTREYFYKYEPSTRLGRVLGNTNVGDGWKFRGRGYVQITGRFNYTSFAKRLKYDLVDNPEVALDCDIAYKIMYIGMNEGLFTGKKLSDYYRGGEFDRVNARRIINGLDRAELIAGYAFKFETIFIRSMGNRGN